MKGGMDLDERGDWEGDAAFAYAHSNSGTESRSRQLTLAFTHIMDDHWTSRASATGWRDSINDVQYFGPSFGITYSAFDQPDEALKGAGGKDWLRVSFDAEFFVYQAAQTTAARVIRISRTSSTVIPAGQGGVSLAQWHPFLMVERPLADGKIVPWGQVGHDFYSKNPSVIEARSGRPQFSASAGSLNGLVGGLLETTVSAGLNLTLPAKVKATGSFGLEKQSTDGHWSTTQSAGLSRLFWDRCKLSASWSRSIQDGVPQDLVTAGGTLFF
ncbi:MAG: hypothetical protein ACHQ2Z_08520 [Elusimicrobiota bacterium]